MVDSFSRDLVGHAVSFCVEIVFEYSLKFENQKKLF